MSTDDATVSGELWLAVALAIQADLRRKDLESTTSASDRPTCRTCRWLFVGQDYDRQRFTCRRRAPLPGHEGDPARTPTVLPMWPRMVASQWCGEHEPSEVGQ